MSLNLRRESEWENERIRIVSFVEVEILVVYCLRKMVSFNFEFYNFSYESPND